MWKNQIKTIVLLGSLSALLIGLGGWIAPGSVWLFVGLAAVMNLGAYFFSDKMVLAVSRAREVPAGEAPWLHDLVEELSARAGIPKPRVYLVPERQPNAFATGRNPAHGVVAVTHGLLELLDRRELRGVLAHELAHIRNRDILVSSIAATIAAAVTSIAHLLSFSAFLGGGAQDEDGPSPIATLFLALVAPIAATLVQLGISRSREYLADETGARLCGDPEALARALAKLERTAERVPAHVAAEPATASLYIVSPLRGAGQALLSLFSTHPPMAERIRRLRALSSGSRYFAGWPVGA
jgi:heat shock protein HtpX